MSGEVSRKESHNRNYAVVNRMIEKPYMAALFLSITFVIFCAGCFWIYDRVVEILLPMAVQGSLLASARDLMVVFITGLFMFAGVSWLLRRGGDARGGLLQQQRALIDAERKALAGVFAASVAHDINNILSGLEGSLSLTGAGASGSYGEGELKSILQQTVHRIAALSQRLSALGRDGMPGEFGEVDVIKVASDAVALARTMARDKGVFVKFSSQEPVMLYANAEMLEQMILNILMNAIDSVVTGGIVELKIKKAEASLLIEIHDGGRGVAPGSQKTLFEVFYSRRPSARGYSLMSVKGCAEAHGGTIEYLDSPLGGTCLRVTLPQERGASLGDATALMHAN